MVFTPAAAVIIEHNVHSTAKCVVGVIVKHYNYFSSTQLLVCFLNN